MPTDVLIRVLAATGDRAEVRVKKGSSLGYPEIPRAISGNGSLVPNQDTTILQGPKMHPAPLNRAESPPSVRVLFHKKKRSLPR